MSSLFNSIRKFIVPIHPEGYIFIFAFVVLALLLGFVWKPLGTIGWFLAAFTVYFFRDPVRVTPTGEHLVVSPADGKVSAVGFAMPPAELGLGEKPLPRVSIFLSVFDVHINRSAVAGKITKIAYTPGLFLNADLDKASEDNERNALVVENAYGKFGMVQIAGLIARRIVCFMREGDVLSPGERFGLIRFGSRVDVFFPEGAQPLVAVGSRAIGGETILADLKSNEAQRNYRIA